MRYEDLSPEQREKVAACQTPEDIMALAKESDYSLTDEDLDQISAGGAWGGGASNSCPSCGSTSHHTIHTGTVNQQNVCNKCGCIWG